MVSCSDGNPCTPDACNGSVGCVVSTGSCDDSNPCTSDACGGQGCSHAYTPGLCAHLPLNFAEPFDCGDTQWAFTPAIAGATGQTKALWAIDGTPMPPAAKSQSCSLNFNDGAGTGGHNSGSAVSNGSFDATGKTKLTLTLWSWFDLRTAKVTDLRIIEASADGFATTPVAVTLDNTAPIQTWSLVTVDLTPLAGKVFQVRFRFDGKTVEPVAWRSGWFVDDVLVVGE